VPLFPNEFDERILIMKKISLIAAVGFFLFSIHTNASEEGMLFNVTGSSNNIKINTVIPNHYYPAAGIRLKTPGYQITSGCSSIANGYCLFGVSDTQQARIITSGNTNILDIVLCLDGNGPNSCQNYNLPTTHYAYITHAFSGSSPYVSVCTLDPFSGAILTCEDAGADSVLSTAGGLGGISINSDAHIAYIASSDIPPNLYECNINSQGSFASCTVIAITPMPYYNYYGLLTYSKTNNIVYTINYATSPTTVLACAVNASGHMSGNCTDTGAIGISSDSVQITVNDQGTVAYIGAYTGTDVMVCDITNGTIFNCVAKSGDGAFITFAEPSAVALSSDESLLYVGNYSNGAIYACSTTSTGSSPFFSACTEVGDIFSTGTDVWSFAVNNNIVYIADYNNTTVCRIASDGTFTDCQESSVVGGPQVALTK
jgi:hypothetical protein